MKGLTPHLSEIMRLISKPDPLNKTNRFGSVFVEKFPLMVGGSLRKVPGLTESWSMAYNLPTGFYGV